MAKQFSRNTAQNLILLIQGISAHKATFILVNEVCLTVRVEHTSRQPDLTAILTVLTQELEMVFKGIRSFHVSRLTMFSQLLMKFQLALL